MANDTVNPPTSPAILILEDTSARACVLAAKLNALLAYTYGESGGAFRNMNDHLQDEYMWSCADMASELKALVAKIDTHVSAAPLQQLNPQS
ncbi:MAG: hypothetical protein RBT42_08145 [Aquabacterium sp.]|jgi:hypothetical protein|uniref:hypothetical protein n=1 Tax=Aquabacterium sp. TaxID=1872578 RepID=UPI002A36E24A|nr:hypothetical protein [Aquabacterium sp.]MDX9843714.1 hypothetical protein [Aquabacterium sp.]